MEFSGTETEWIYKTLNADVSYCQKYESHFGGDWTKKREKAVLFRNKFKGYANIAEGEMFGIVLSKKEIIKLTHELEIQTPNLQSTVDRSKSSYTARVNAGEKILLIRGINKKLKLEISTHLNTLK